MTTKQPSRFQKIRDYLQANEGPRTAAEIAEGIGHEGPRIRVSFAINTMITDGWLVNVTPKNRPARFALLRTEKIERAKPDPATKTKQRRDRERERDQARRTMTPEQYRDWLASCKQRTQAQKAADQAEALRIQQMVADLRAANSARAAVRARKSAAQQSSVRRRGPDPIIIPRSFDITAPVPVVVPLPTSADFIAAGGVIQRLADGDVSPRNRLRHIGLRA